MMAESVPAVAADIRLTTTADLPSPQVFPEFVPRSVPTSDSLSTATPASTTTKLPPSLSPRLGLTIHPSGGEHCPWLLVPVNSVRYWLSTQPHLQVCPADPPCKYVLQGELQQRQSANSCWRRKRYPHYQN